MKRVVALMVVLLLAVTACGGGEGGDDESPAGDQANTAGDEGSGGGGSVVEQQPPGQGYASVDGLEYTLTLPGGLDCTVADDEFTFSYRIGDNEVVLGGGASLSGGQWVGSLTLGVFANNNVTTYSAKLVDNPSGIAVDGDSVSYSGPMERYAPSSDGSPPEPEDVGNGTFSSTCG